MNKLTSTPAEQPPTRGMQSGDATAVAIMRASSTIEVDYISANLHPSNGHQDYVARRMALWNEPSHGASYSEVEIGAISRLPLPLQVAFRHKMLAIFALQLLFVWAIVGIFRYYEPAVEYGDKVFRDRTAAGKSGDPKASPSVGNIALAFATALVLLVALYALRNRFPLNWLLLAVFSVAQSGCFVGLGVLLDTNIGFFNCAFTFACVLIMIALAGVQKRNKALSATESTTLDGQNGKLLSSFYAGVLAYLVVATVTSVLYVTMGQKIVTSEGFWLTLAFQLALMLWFSSDAASMYRVMSPDEYMHGVIYFYTDLILLAIVTAVAVGTVVVCTAMCSEGGSCDADCSGAAMCYCGPVDCSCCSSSRARQDDNGLASDDVMHRV